MPTQFRNPVGRLLNKLPPRAQLPARLFLWCVALFIAWHSINYLQGNRNLSISGQVLDPAGEPLANTTLTVTTKRYKWWVPRFLPVSEYFSTDVTVRTMTADSEGRFDARAIGFWLEVYGTRTAFAGTPREIDIQSYPSNQHLDVDYRAWPLGKRYDRVIWRDLIDFIPTNEISLRLPPRVRSTEEFLIKLDETDEFSGDPSAAESDYPPTLILEVTPERPTGVQRWEFKPAVQTFTIKGASGHRLLPTQTLESSCPEGEYVESFSFDVQHPLPEQSADLPTHRFYVRHPDGTLYAAVEIVPLPTPEVVLIRFVANSTENDLHSELSKHLFGEVKDWEWDPNPWTLK